MTLSSLTGLCRILATWCHSKHHVLVSLPVLVVMEYTNVCMHLVLHNTRPRLLFHTTVSRWSSLLYSFHLARQVAERLQVYLPPSGNHCGNCARLLAKCMSINLIKFITPEDHCLGKQASVVMGMCNLSKDGE